jgi:hypothetical protein
MRHSTDFPRKSRQRGHLYVSSCSSRYTVFWILAPFILIRVPYVVLVDGTATDKNIVWTNPANKKLETKDTSSKALKEEEPTRMARKFTRKVCAENHLRHLDRQERGLRVNWKNAILQIDIQKIIERLPLKFREQLVCIQCWVDLSLANHLSYNFDRVGAHKEYGDDIKDTESHTGRTVRRCSWMRWYKVTFTNGSG